MPLFGYYTLIPSVRQMTGAFSDSDLDARIRLKLKKKPITTVQCRRSCLSWMSRTYPSVGSFQTRRVGRQQTSAIWSSVALSGLSEFVAASVLELTPSGLCCRPFGAELRVQAWRSCPGDHRPVAPLLDADVHYVRLPIACCATFARKPLRVM